MRLLPALRPLVRAPAFALTALLTLSVGIAAIGAMFALVHGVLLAPLPYGDSERLLSIGLTTTTATRVPQPPALYENYARWSKHLDSLAIYRTGNANLWLDGATAPAERVTATWITASMLPTLRIKPLLGRGFNAVEERVGGPGVVILSEAEWRQRFGGAPDVLGRILVINSVPREVVGVMPAGFAFPTADTRVWLPARMPSDATVSDFAYQAIGRAAPSATPAEVREELTAILPRLAEQFPRLDSGAATATWLDDVRPTPTVVPWRQELTSGIARTLWLLMGAAILVLLIAWANVTNLVLVRADDRQAELAMRVALGASPWRVVLASIREVLVLSAVAGVIAGIIATVALRLLVAFGPASVPRLESVGVGAVGFVFIVAITALTALVCAGLPALRARRLLAFQGRVDGPRETATRPRQRLRLAIAAAQIALALVVSIASLLLLRTAQHLAAVRPGFDAGQVTVLWMQLPFARYDEAAAVTFFQQLTDRVRALPGVEHAGLTHRVPLDVTGEPLRQSLRVDRDGRALSLPVQVIDDQYFATLRIPLLAGTSFQPLDRAQADHIILSQRAARLLFDDAHGDAVIGKTVALAPEGPRYTVIGVVGDVRDQDLATAPEALIYRPQRVALAPTVEPEARRAMALVVRADMPAETLVPAIREIARQLDATAPVFNVQSLDEVLRASTARLSLALALMTVAAGVALLLGAIGLYGVMAYTVTLRTREFGVRLALGARPAQIGGLIARHGLTVTVVGIGLGLGLHALATPFLRAFLHGVTADDPLTLLGAALLLITTAAIASSIPARRATRVDPATSLRAA